MIEATILIIFSIALTIKSTIIDYKSNIFQRIEDFVNKYILFHLPVLKMFITSIFKMFFETMNNCNRINTGIYEMINSNPSYAKSFFLYETQILFLFTVLVLCFIYIRELYIFATNIINYASSDYTIITLFTIFIFLFITSSIIKSKTKTKEQTRVFSRNICIIFVIIQCIIYLSILSSFAMKLVNKNNLKEILFASNVLKNNTLTEYMGESVGSLLLDSLKIITLTLFIKLMIVFFIIYNWISSKKYDEKKSKKQRIFISLLYIVFICFMYMTSNI